jgi:hypothetical protein
MALDSFLFWGRPPPQDNGPRPLSPDCLVFPLYAFHNRFISRVVYRYELGQ